MGGTGTGSVGVDETPQVNILPIVEETNGKTYALSRAWVTFRGMRLVLAFEVDEDGKVLDADNNERWCTEELTSLDGAVTHSDANIMARLTVSQYAWVWARLEAILVGEAQCGPLFEDDLSRVLSEEGADYALAEAWVTHDDTRYVRLRLLDEENGVLRHDAAYMDAEQKGEGDDATYSTNAVEDARADLRERIDVRLSAIIAGTAESGPLE